MMDISKEVVTFMGYKVLI